MDKRERVLLNMGCGATMPKNWSNFDCSINILIQGVHLLGALLSSVFRTQKYSQSACSYINLNGRWPIANHSADVVYASHVLEHLTQKNAELFLSEAHRVLKKGACLRLVLPDLYMLSKKYVRDTDLGSKKASAEFLWALNLHLENTYPKETTHIIRKFLGWMHEWPLQHKYMYDFHTLKDVVIRHGFTNVELSRYGASHWIPEVCDVEHEQESIASFYLETIKE